MRHWGIHRRPQSSGQDGSFRHVLHLSISPRNFVKSKFFRAPCRLGSVSTHPAAQRHISSDSPTQTTLNDFAALGRETTGAVRLFVKYLMVEMTPILRDDAELRKQCIVKQADATMHLPFAIGDFTDFLNSRTVSRFWFQTLLAIVRSYVE